MAEYIISRREGLTRVDAVEYNHLLFDAASSRPLLDPQKYARLSPQEKQYIDELFAAVPDNLSITAQFGFARQLATEGRVAKRLYEIDGRINKPNRDWLRRELGREFAPFRFLGTPAVIKRCAFHAPGPASLIVKLAGDGEYIFSPQDVAALRQQPETLARLGRHDLAALLRGESSVPATPSRLSMLEAAQAWYGLAGTHKLQLMAELFGGVEATLNMVDERARWKSTSILSELKYMQSLNAPRMRQLQKSVWVRRIAEQMNRRYDAETDLMKLYPRLHSIDAIIERQGINLATAPAEQLFALEDNANFARAAEFPAIARLCRQGGNAEAVFNRAVSWMTVISATDLVPSIYIDGSALRLPDMEIVKLAKTDPMIMFAGAFVKCCGHVGGDASKRAMTKAMVTHPEVGCYVTRDKASGTPTTKLGVWLGKIQPDGRYDFVFNAWHGVDHRLNAMQKHVLVYLAERLHAADPMIRRVMLGATGKRLSFPQAEPAELRDPALATRDTRTQFQIASYASSPA